ncbi:MAG: hypothetical protein OXH49_08285 [Gemmatimonadetes bacterium]|nr:hypothetical protein [Gemmatimonadota bacterium]
MTTLITPCSLFLLLLLPVPDTHSPDATSRPDEASPTSLQIPQEPSVDTAAFLAAFEPLRILTLEENEDVVTVFPRMAAGHADELLVIDELEVQVRLYGRDGSLRTVIGRRGEGPGEFKTPMSASRAMDGRIVVADPSLSRISFFSPEGTFENLVGNVPVRLLWDVKDLGGDRLLLLGPGGDDVGQPRFLHIWDAQAERVERRFLPMGLPVASRPAGLSFPAVSAVVEADTIWAAWALSDTLYKFTRGGERLSEVPMPLLRPTGPVPAIEGVVPANPDAISNITQVADVFPLSGGEFAVQSARMRFGDFEADLLIMDRLGQPRLQLARSPRLLFVDREGLYYFDDPASVLPNRLIVARRR